MHVFGACAQTKMVVAVCCSNASKGRCFLHFSYLSFFTNLAPQKKRYALLSTTFLEYGSCNKNKSKLKLIVQTPLGRRQKKKNKREARKYRKQHTEREEKKNLKYLSSPPTDSTHIKQAKQLCEEYNAGVN